jgi:acyl-coenzyme A thioesterase PaaI-like protein
VGRVLSTKRIAHKTAQIEAKGRFDSSGTADALQTKPVMPVDSENAQARMQQTQGAAHPFCFVCSGSNPMGLALRYGAQPDGSVAATFLGSCALEGYAGLLHGGVIAALLDGAMTNCLFARRIAALTVELRVRFHAGVAAAEAVTVSARLEDESHGLYQLRAELAQGGAVKASATGKFMTT